MIESYLTHLKAAGQRRATVQLREFHLKRLQRELGALHTLSLADLEQFLANPDFGNSYRRSLRATLRGFYSWLQATGQRSDNPAALLAKVPATPPKPRPTPDIAYRRALKDADEDLVLMLRLGAEAGLRRGEVALLHSRDVVEDLNGISLLVHGKGGKERIVPLNAALGRLVVLRSQEMRGWFFPGRIDGHISAAWVGKRISRLLPDGIGMHTLRHRFATRTWSATHDLLSVQQLLGHASPATTQLYVGVEVERLRAVASEAA
ncbi:tyrosine-type recombinase/integrase [Arcanobacterium canis]